MEEGPGGGSWCRVRGDAGAGSSGADVEPGAARHVRCLQSCAQLAVPQPRWCWCGADQAEDGCGCAWAQPPQGVIDGYCGAVRQGGAGRQRAGGWLHLTRPQGCWLCCCWAPLHFLLPQPLHTRRQAVTKLPWLGPGGRGP